MKTKTIREYTIKIDRVFEIKPTDIDYGEEQKDKLFLVEIKDICGVETYFSVPASRNSRASLRKVFERIKKELYLN